MEIFGLLKVGNESHILDDTLNIWKPVCTGGIFIYGDNCDIHTQLVCRYHTAVREYIHSNLYDPNRARAEQHNRQVLLDSISRFATPNDWVVVFDADEHLYEFGTNVLRERCSHVVCRLYEVHITPEDENEYYRYRQWVSPRKLDIPFFYRWHDGLRFERPDQRILTPAHEGGIRCGYIKHWSKGFAPWLYQRKVEYYQQWPKYAEKWALRDGLAVKHDMCDDFGAPLIKWEDAIANDSPT